jgi:THO complex subunit 2 N-terminus
MTLVAALDLISSKSSYDKNEVRRVRACWGYPLFSFHPGYRIHSLIPIYRSYKQNKFNLLREQPEGFSNFVTEVIGPIWKRIVSFIGYFDLDPNRALDASTYFSHNHARELPSNIAQLVALERSV